MHLKKPLYDKTVWKIHTFVWKKKTQVIDRIELLLGWA